MKRRIRILLGVAVITGLVAPAGALAFSGGPAMAAPPSTPARSITCTGGDFGTGNLTKIHSGTYASITVKGACAVAPNAVITVLGNVNVAAGAVLDAQSAPATITVDHSVNAAAGSLLGLGCLPNPVGHTTGHPCSFDPHLHSDITVLGNVSALDADTVLLNGITVDGNVTLIGGGEDVVPWSIKNNTIGHNLLVAGVTPNWIGFILNHVGGNAILTDITITDPGDPNPTIFIASNTVAKNLVCWGLGPAVSGGFPGEVNVVGGQALGQCANLPDE